MFTVSPKPEDLRPELGPEQVLGHVLKGYIRNGKCLVLMHWVLELINMVFYARVDLRGRYLCYILFST